jgi:hypothetical protein
MDAGLLGEKTMKITFMIDILDSNLGGTENQLIKMINGSTRENSVELICFDNSQWFEANAKRLTADQG